MGSRRDARQKGRRVVSRFRLPFVFQVPVAIGFRGSGGVLGTRKLSWGEEGVSGPQNCPFKTPAVFPNASSAALGTTALVQGLRKSVYFVVGEGRR